MSSAFFVKGDEHDEGDIGKFYAMYEWNEALADFLKRIYTDECATLTWSS